jgi:uncharacterized membrane protein
MESPDQPRSEPPLKTTVEGNIRAIAVMQEHLHARRNLIDRIADVIGNFSGSMAFVFLHVTWFTFWFLWNTGVIPNHHRFDPFPFILLAMIVSVEGVLLSTFVLMKQNRMQRQSDTRDHINLQIDLLAEEEVTKSLQLLRAICRKLEITEADLDAELAEMASATSLDTLAGDVQSKLMQHEE